MKLRLLLPAALVLTAVLPAQARPVSVTLYPAGALVTEEETVRLEKDVVLTLPADADAESLSVSLSSGVVLESRLKTGSSPSPAMEALEGDMESLRAELSRVAAERETLSFERRFWSDPPVSLQPGDLQALKAQAEESRTRLDGLAQRETALAARKRALEKDMKKLEARMEALGKHNAAVQECALVIDGKGPVTARWTYFLPGASWQPSYRVTAEEETGLVRVAMNAVMRQDSGADWTDVDVTLASAEDLHSVEPPALPSWIEGEERPVMRPANLMAARAADAKSAAVQNHATGLRWSLGRMDVPAEGRITRLVAAHEFPASFCRLVRPLQDSRAFFTATLASEQVPLLPSGQALFLVNGTENARGLFRLNAGQKEIFFGVDQLVTLKTHELSAKDTDVPVTARTRQWSWRTDIANGHDRAVDVCAESAAPILRDASMNVRTKSRPAAEFSEERSCYEWRLEVPAHGEATITHEVTITSPAAPSGGKS